MRKNCWLRMAAGMLVLALMAGCAPNGDGTDLRAGGFAFNDEDNGGDQAKEQGNKQPEENKKKKSQSQSAASDEDIEKELAAYRAEREKGTSEDGDYTLVKAPNEENYKYGVGVCENEPDFDARELAEAYETADAYIRDTLKLDSEAEWCADPRMNAIYSDEDKGVADGYEPENIFLCEYNEHGTWRYLILVREGKGADWSVLYHGDSYKKKKRAERGGKK